MINISVVSYLNSLPFIYGLKESNLINKISLSLDYPSVCARKLINMEIDVGLVPSVLLKDYPNLNIISDYCIGSDDKVETVCIYSEVPIEKVKIIYLDYQSNTSVELLKILIREYWNISPELIDTSVGFEKLISGKNAALVIGDRAFELNSKYKFIYDLSSSWKDLTGLPFVFAVWASYNMFSLDFIREFNNALGSKLNKIDSLIKDYENISDYCKDPKNYLKYKISYLLDEKKKESMRVFFNKIIR